MAVVKSITVADGLLTAASGGTVDTADITADAVTFAKMQNIATARLLGRSTASSGDIEEIQVGSGLTLSSGTLSASGGGSYTDEEAQDAVGGILTDTSTIDFTYSDGTPSITADVKDDSITFAKMQNINSARVLGRATIGSGDVEALELGAGLHASAGYLSMFSSPPASAGSPGSPGDFAYDDNYLYICIDASIWKRVAISTW